MPSKEERYDEAIELQQAGKLDEAVGKLEELSTDEPDYALSHSALSVFYSKLEKHDEAIERAQKACDLEPEDPFGFIALSLVCQKGGRVPEAEAALMKARQAQVGGEGPPVG